MSHTAWTLPARADWRTKRHLFRERHFLGWLMDACREGEAQRRRDEFYYRCG